MRIIRVSCKKERKIERKINNEEIRYMADRHRSEKYEKEKK
jgi:hypothetical protein